MAILKKAVYYYSFILINYLLLFLAFEVRFVHPSIGQSSTVNLEFVDAKTMSFNTPPCPVTLTRENPTISIPIVVTQGDTEIARVDFIYQSC